LKYLLNQAKHLSSFLVMVTFIPMKIPPYFSSKGWMLDMKFGKKSLAKSSQAMFLTILTTCLKKCLHFSYQIPDY